MHSMKMIASGLALLCVLYAGRAWFAPSVGEARLFACFSLAWLCIGTINLIVGMQHAGYGFREELPFFLLVSGVPVAVALIAWKR